MTGPFAPSPQSGKVQRTIYASANRQTHRSQFVELNRFVGMWPLLLKVVNRPLTAHGSEIVTGERVQDVRAAYCNKSDDAC
jgi:hypothetical protein